MKKLIIALALVALLAGHVYASQDVKTVISETTLTESALRANSGTISIEGARKVSFFVNCNTNVDSVTGEVTVEISYDGVHWLQASFKDFVGGSTLQTYEDINQGYYLWLDPDYIIAPYARIGIHLDSDTIGAGDYATISVNIIKEQ
jgi:opacity protein-like surface antigen